jgi:hypothetical protein
MARNVFAGCRYDSTPSVPQCSSFAAGLMSSRVTFVSSTNFQQGDYMNRLLRIFTAGAIAVAMSGMTWADQSTSQQSSQTEPQASDKPTTGASDKSNKAEAEKSKDAYEAKLKKCDNVAADVAGKQQCINKVQKDDGQM